MPVTRYLYTFNDIVDHLMDFIGADGADSNDRRQCRRAAQTALREIGNLKSWSYYASVGRVNAVASYATGTITYDHTGSTYERELTLASGTWPTWAQTGTVLISNVPYDVYDRKSSTVLTLSANSNPGEDVAAGTEYTIYRDAYPLPTNFLTLLSPVIDVSSKIPITFVKPADWFQQQRWQNSPGVPWSCTIVGDPNYQDIPTLRLQPPSSSARRYDFAYKRTPRRLAIDEYREGTITASSTTVTGTDATFTSNMVGCVIRPSNTADDVTGLAGSNPFTEERIITAFTDASTLTIDSAFTGTYTAKKYVISDPVDVESQVMLNLYLRTAELQLATTRRPNDRAAVYAAWQKEYEVALAADNRYSATRQVTGGVGMDYAQYILTYGTTE